ncbi:uncharacterized protein TRAVEDRAFT_48891 [Trametes versicolor FP-101664 SS1]|uniref:uncharacterized protein n=1 Tax=Trametes versicolor (strain FP-101664) TaxID=717944 RepID=UPI000462164E|nr:uncharacterized protein TRAVEDRAFT_48891 [Trametes versicolor FP-101664 SS1]EIW57865.1 hypothetical protein TRAVEDRAFT_48891 [Trametes versicolor FP-101664 SS1]
MSDPSALSPGMVASTPMSAILEAPPAIDNLYGAYLLGTFVSLVLYGVSLHQLYLYARTSKTDTALIRSLVTLVMLLETLHAALLMHTCYYYLVSNYDDVTGEKVFHSVSSMQVTPVITTLVTLTSQIIKLDSLTGFERGGDWLFPLATGSATSADLLLSSAIVFSVWRSRVGHIRPKTEGPFDVAVLYVLNSGLLTGIANTPSVIAGIYLPQTFIWAAFNFIGARFYAITLLSVLNSRKFSATRGMEIFDAARFGPGIIARANHIAAVERWNAPQVPDAAPAKININVEAEVEVHQQRDSDGTKHYRDHKAFDSSSV